MSDNARRDDVFRKVDGATPLELTPEQDRLVEATAWHCLEAIGRAIQQEPEDARLLMSLLIAHAVHATVLGTAAECCGPAVREHLAQDAAQAIARAVREAAPP
jgi:hypothetical protein